MIVVYVVSEELLIVNEGPILAIEYMKHEAEKEKNYLLQILMKYSTYYGHGEENIISQGI